MAADLEAKQEELQLKQAKRQKAMSLTNSIVNTDLGVTAALTVAPPAGYIMASITAAMGAAQIAMITSTPITTGAEEGGQVIERMQDGKKDVYKRQQKTCSYGGFSCRWRIKPCITSTSETS